MPWLQEHFEEIEIVNKKMVKKVARAFGALAHIECSAKNGQGVGFLFDSILPGVLNEHVLKKKSRPGIVKKIGKIFQSGKKEDDSIETQSTRSN